MQHLVKILLPFLLFITCGTDKPWLDLNENDVLDDLKLNPNEVLMIGDDLHNDIYGAQKLKIKGILVKTGKYRSESIKDYGIAPDGIIDSIGDIAKILNTSI